MQTFGCFIDRDENRHKLVKVFKGAFVKQRQDFKLFLPSDINYGENLSVNYMLLIQVETNIKLNLITKEG